MRRWKAYKKDSKDSMKNSIKYNTDLLEFKNFAEKHLMFKLVEDYLIDLEFKE